MGARTSHGAFGLAAATAAILAALSGGRAWAQNLEAGKAGAQIFAEVCSGCHRSARELRNGASASFLREHYTTGSDMASTMAAYLASAANDPRAAPAPKQRSPVAGTPASASPQQATAEPRPVAPPPAPPQSGRPRPGVVRADPAKPVAAAEAKPAPAPPPRILEEFEE